MVRVSVGVLARNNEDIIGPCLDSVQWADDLFVILDTRSSDATDSIAEMHGARVVRHPFEDFARQREFGLTQHDCDWLFYLDSDERATDALAAEIRKVVAKNDPVGWWVPRRNFLFGHETRHGGWYPDYQLRLLKRGHAHYDLERQVHEVVDLDGPAGHLCEPLLHHNYETLGQFRAKQQQYVSYEAAIRYQNGVRPKPWTYVLQPLREFWRRYIALSGYRDGVHGLVLCTLVAYYYGYLVTVQLGRLWAQRGENLSRE